MYINTLMLYNFQQNSNKNKWKHNSTFNPNSSKQHTKIVSLILGTGYSCQDWHLFLIPFTLSGSFLKCSCEGSDDHNF